jgi:hypothetical protein
MSYRPKPGIEEGSWQFAGKIFRLVLAGYFDSSTTSSAFTQA